LSGASKGKNFGAAKNPFFQFFSVCFKMVTKHVAIFFMIFNRKVVSLLVFLCGAFSLSCSVQPDIDIETYQKEHIIPLLPLLNTWADREFAHYPYLLSAPKDQIVCPSDIIFINAPDAMIALAKIQGEVVGMVAMISFDSPVVHALYFNRFHLLQKIQALGFDPSQMLYAAYFLTAPEHHNDEAIVHALYNTLARFAHELGKTQVCFMEDVGEFPHPLKPTKKMYIEPWADVIQGSESMGLQIPITWPTLDAEGVVKDKEHTLEFFVKNVSSK
jgi:hypothetical protein